MAEPLSGGDQVSRRLDDELARHPGDVDENPDADLWDTPGRDGIVSDAQGDPDRTGPRSEIGQYVSLVDFPAKVATLVASARRADAPDQVVAQLSTLDPHTTYANPGQLWDALGLGSGRRF
jgi:hypothetical protein